MQIPVSRILPVMTRVTTEDMEQLDTLEMDVAAPAAHEVKKNI